MASHASSRNLIWVPVVVSIVAAVLYGVFTIASIRSPATPAQGHDPDRPWVLDVEAPWVEEGPRSFDYGTVPFVPSKSAFAHTPFDSPPMPNPAAIRRRPPAERRTP